MKTDTSSDDIPRYLPAFEKIVVDYLGRKIQETEREVAAKTEWFRPKTVGEMPTKDERSVVILPDHNIAYPTLGLKVFVVGPEMDCRGISHMFARACCRNAADMYDADLVVFTGGPDVDPGLYGKKPMDCISVDEDRDSSDIVAYLEAVYEGIPMFGICRGAQFLAVMNNFKLYQHVDNHQRDHQMWDCKNNKLLECVSSVHHQSVIPGPGLEVLGKAWKSANRWEDAETQVSGQKPNDVEAFFIRENCCVGVQGHPEYRGYPEYTAWCLKLIEDYILCNSDVDFRDNRRRLRPELLEERNLRRESRRAQILEHRTLTLVK